MVLSTSIVVLAVTVTSSNDFVFRLGLVLLFVAVALLLPICSVVERYRLLQFLNNEIIPCLLFFPIEEDDSVPDNNVCNDGRADGELPVSSAAGDTARTTIPCCCDCSDMSSLDKEHFICCIDDDDRRRCGFIVNCIGLCLVILLLLFFLLLGLQ